MSIRIDTINLHLHAPQSAQPILAGAMLAALSERAKGQKDSRGRSLPLIGDVWDEERGVFLGVLPHLATRRNYALILPLHKGANLGPRKWGEPGVDIPDATSATDGMANTQAMAAAGNKLGQEVVELVLDGESGLYIPARHETRLAFLTAADHFDKKKWHHTSTQAGAHYAWFQNFDDGNQGYGKDNETVVRLVRRSFL